VGEREQLGLLPLLQLLTGLAVLVARRVERSNW
jgi:hypothetical protein